MGSKLIVKGDAGPWILSAARSVLAKMHHVPFGISVAKRAVAARGCGSTRT